MSKRVKDMTPEERREYRREVYRRHYAKIKADKVLWAKYLASRRAYYHKNPDLKNYLYYCNIAYRERRDARCRVDPVYYAEIRRKDRIRGARLRRKHDPKLPPICFDAEGKARRWHAIPDDCCKGAVFDRSSAHIRANMPVEDEALKMYAIDNSRMRNA